MRDTNLIKINWRW